MDCIKISEYFRGLYSSWDSIRVGILLATLRYLKFFMKKKVILQDLSQMKEKKTRAIFSKFLGPYGFIRMYLLKYTSAT